MHLQVFENLGVEIENAYRKANYSDQAFAEIAESALRNFEFDSEINLADLLSLQFSQIQAQDEHLFSDLSTRVFQADHFYIEILFWASASTSIHQHGFSGAFKLLEGSSLQTTYEFVAKENISEFLQLGDVQSSNSDILKKGDIRQIKSGKRGLIHSLYHLDQPSITLVVRTNWEPWAQPQMKLIRPNIAIASLDLAADKRVKNALRCYYAAKSAQDETALERWVTLVSNLDWPRIYQVCLELKTELIESPLRSAIEEKILQGHAFGQVLSNAIDTSYELSDISATRGNVSDPELRYLLALLLNIQDRTTILELVQYSFPNEKSETLVARWIIRLGDLKNVLISPNQAKSGSNIPSKMNINIARGINMCPTENLMEVIIAVVEQTPEEQLKESLKKTASDADVEKCLEAYNFLAGLSELQPLLSKRQSG